MSKYLYYLFSIRTQVVNKMAIIIIDQFWIFQVLRSETLINSITASFIHGVEKAFIDIRCRTIIIIMISVSLER